MKEKSSSFDVMITQQGDTYVVSGKDAAALHVKMQTLPPEAQSFVISELANGKFTMQKTEPQAKAAAG